MQGEEGGEDNGGKQSEFFKVIGSDGSFHLSGKICLPGGVGDKRSGGLAVQPHPITCQLSRPLSLKPLPCLLSAPASHTLGAGSSRPRILSLQRRGRMLAGPVWAHGTPRCQGHSSEPLGRGTSYTSHHQHYWEGKMTRKSGGWGRLHRERQFLRTFPRMRVLQNECLCPHEIHLLKPNPQRE